MTTVHGAHTSIHRHARGLDVIEAAHARARNTTLVIGAEQSGGVLLLDIDVQADVCRDASELIDHLSLVIEALKGYDPMEATR